MVHGSLTGIRTVDRKAESFFEDPITARDALVQTGFASATRKKHAVKAMASGYRLRA